VAEADPKTARDGIEPVESGAITFCFAMLVHLILPTSGHVWINDAGWPWLDPYRLHLSNMGWPLYLAAGFAIAVGVAMVVAACHWAIRQMAPRHPRARWAIGTTFGLCGAVAGFVTPWLLHPFYRVQIPLH
jgi:hypothetical protein